MWLYLFLYIVKSVQLTYVADQIITAPQTLIQKNANGVYFRDFYLLKSNLFFLLQHLRC